MFSKARAPKDTELDVLINRIRSASNTKSLIRNPNIYAWTLTPSKRILTYNIARNLKTLELFQPTTRLDTIGFRPAFELKNPEDFDAESIQPFPIATAYMDNEPIEISDENILNYRPGTEIKFGQPVQDARYQIMAMRIGNTAIATNVILKNISFADLVTQRLAVAATEKQCLQVMTPIGIIKIVENSDAKMPSIDIMLTGSEQCEKEGKTEIKLGEIRYEATKLNYVTVESINAKMSGKHKSTLFM